MKTKILNIKADIENITGLKVSIKKANIKSSMKGYIIFTAKKQKNEFSQWSFEDKNKLLQKYDAPEPHPTFVNKYQVNIYFGVEIYNFDFRPPKKAKKKAIEQPQKEPREVLSLRCPNPQQLRMDKAARRYARNSRLGKTGVRYN